MTETAMAIPDGVAPQHPEAQYGEVFLKNVRADEPDEFAEIDYQSKRAGVTAYDPCGQVLMHMFPVFVWRAEYNNRFQETKIGQ